MNRITSLNTPLNKHISLISELIIQKLYKIEGSGPFAYSGFIHNKHLFVNINSNNTKEISNIELEKLLQSNQIQPTTEIDNPNITEPDYPYLDTFTYNTFITTTKELWQNNNTLDTFSRSQLLDLNTLCSELELLDIPTPGTPEYMTLIQDPRWSTLKQYIKTFSPDIQLPEQFA